MRQTVFTKLRALAEVWLVRFSSDCSNGLGHSGIVGGPSEYFLDLAKGLAS
ncbi:MAG TPA: hypothetical protein VG055_25760 [Planctomycetaceae bacterium]|nr:hypothetical protein [Planctomycetaceae bacterium]